MLSFSLNIHSLYQQVVCVCMCGGYIYTLSLHQYALFLSLSLYTLSISKWYVCACVGAIYIYSLSLSMLSFSLYIYTHSPSASGMCVHVRGLTEQMTERPTNIHKRDLLNTKETY